MDLCHSTIESMIANTPPPLLRLPAELRNHIYQEVLAQVEKPFLLSAIRQSPSMHSVCRQIREACNGLFYSTTTFQFDNPSACLNFLTNLSHEHCELVQEIRYDCSEVCSNPVSWRRAFLDLPGLDEDVKISRLRNQLAEKDIFLQEDVLKASIKINGRLVWTGDPLGEVRAAVQNGSLVGRVMFV